MIAEGKLSFGHAKVLAGLTGDERGQVQLAGRCVDKGWSVRELERVVADHVARRDGAGRPGDEAGRRRRDKAPFIRDIEERLTRSVGTRVLIAPGRGKDSGRIVIDYYNLDDFDRIAQRLGLQGED